MFKVYVFLYFRNNLNFILMNYYFLRSQCLGHNCHIAIILYLRFIKRETKYKQRE